MSWFGSLLFGLLVGLCVGIVIGVSISMPVAAIVFLAIFGVGMLITIGVDFGADRIERWFRQIFPGNPGDNEE